MVQEQSQGGPCECNENDVCHGISKKGIMCNAYSDWTNGENLAECGDEREETYCHGCISTTPAAVAGEVQRAPCPQKQETYSHNPSKNTKS